MNVAGLAGHCNLERAHEVANDCKRLNKALKECQDLAQIYNNRERLFNLTATNVSVKIVFFFEAKFLVMLKQKFEKKHTLLTSRRKQEKSVVPIFCSQII